MTCSHGYPFKGYKCPTCRAAKQAEWDALRSRFPYVLAHVYCGFDLMPGWKRPVLQLCELLERLGGVRCVQVKQKLGGLRFYIESANPYEDHFTRRGLVSVPCPDRDLARALVNACEAACWTLCERCGEPGRLMNEGGYLTTTCEPCHVAAEEENERQSEHDEAE